MNPFDGLSVCRECHKPIDMKRVGSVQVRAHGRTFCSMKCSDAWEQNPENAEAVSASHEEAERRGLPYDATKIVRGRWSP
jgi:hypothetical protein